MAPRKKVPAPGPELPTQAGPAEHPVLKEAPVQTSVSEAPAPDTALVEYLAGGEAWSCSRFDRLRAEFEHDLTPATLPKFHALLRSKERGWEIVRRLFALQPVTPGMDTKLEDLQAWSRERLMAEMGLTPQQLADELELLRGYWRAGHQSKLWTQGKAELELPPAKPATGNGLLDLGEHPRLKEFKFFNMQFLSSAERAWFVERIGDFEKVLREPMVASMARNLLMAEVRIRRLEENIQNMPVEKVGTSEWQQLVKLNSSLGTDYDKALTRLLEECPWASQLAGKYALRGALAEVTQGIQEFQARADQRLIDGIHTAAEVKILCRRSVQNPVPNHRIGLVAYLLEAKEGMWDPNWQTQFEDADFGRLDKAFQQALVATGNQAGEHVPDLMKDGAEGEYEEV